MDLRKYGKPPKKVLSAEHALGIGKKKKPKKPKKSRKDKPKKGKPKKGKPKSILSKTLKRAVTTDQSLRNSTQQQFLENLHGRLNNNDGRTNGIWNSYKRNLTAQSFGGTPYELYRLREESDILREMLERATNDGRRRPQVSTTETQTETAPQQTAPQQNQPTTPTTTPPPLPIRPAPIVSHLGFGQVYPARTSSISPARSIPEGGLPVGSSAMSVYIPQPIEGKPPKRGIPITIEEIRESQGGLTDAEKEQKKKHDKKESRYVALGDTSNPYRTIDEVFEQFGDDIHDIFGEKDSNVDMYSDDMPFEDGDGNELNYSERDEDSTDDPVSSSLGVNSFDDDEEEKAPPMPAGEEPEDEYDSGEEEPMSDSDDLIQLDDMEGDMADERDAYDFD
jgi:hypothetical protein